MELVLGIESTCDETGVALVRGTELIADVVASSMDEHARFGGIVPEVASRAHLEAFIPTLESALDKAGASLGDVDAIAVAAGPGLVGSLTVGVSAAKALSLALDRPLYGVNHVIGHAVVDELVHGEFPERTMALVVSGGHTSLLLFEGDARRRMRLASRSLATPSTTPRVRPSTRWGACSACRTRAGRTLTGSRVKATRKRFAFRAR